MNKTLQTKITVNDMYDATVCWQIHLFLVFLA